VNAVSASLPREGRCEGVEQWDRPRFFRRLRRVQPTPKPGRRGWPSRRMALTTSSRTRSPTTPSWQEARGARWPPAAPRCGEDPDDAVVQRIAVGQEVRPPAANRSRSDVCGRPPLPRGLGEGGRQLRHEVRADLESNRSRCEPGRAGPWRWTEGLDGATRSPRLCVRRIRRESRGRPAARTEVAGILGSPRVRFGKRTEVVGIARFPGVRFGI
jgi:hypothetical protein